MGRVLSDERNALDWDKVNSSTGSAMGAGPGGEGSGAGVGRLQIPAEVREKYQEMFEDRWCAELVPALGGVTPRQAAADPSRREALERLLAEWEREDGEGDEDAIVMRPQRLREMLGLAGR
ncbi:MAG: hypothetical protein ACRDZX_09680 [Acidimicrobiales bacterium]